MGLKAEEFFEKHLLTLDDKFTKQVGEILVKRIGLRFAIKREALVNRMLSITYKGLSEVSRKDRELMDRKVRKAIEDLRSSGWLIGSSMSGSGYYMISNKLEFENFRKEYIKRAVQVFKTAEEMDKAANKLFGKPEPKQMGWLD